MNTRNVVLAIVLSLSISCTALADRELDRTEILEIFEKLTSQPQKTWISAGTIEAKHEEYRASKTANMADINSQIAEMINTYQGNMKKRELTTGLQKMKLDAMPFNVRYKQSNTYTMNSNVIVRYDGDRFYWEIDVSSRTDSVIPEASLEGNYMTDEFNLNYNKRRIFAWDGQKYTHYFLPGNHALVDTAGSKPRAVNGPLTAGHIPWGYGNCTYENLCTAESYAEEKHINDQTQIHLTINNSNGSQMVFVMDPEKDYAVISSRVDNLETITTTQYSDYQRVSGKWIPTNIFVEKHDSITNRQLSYDIWNFTSISGETPSAWSFNVEFENSLVEYRCPLTNKPIIYNSSYTVNTDKLLLDRLSYLASEDTQQQNCATAALKYIINKLGKDVTDQQLAQLVSGQDETTNLYNMKEFVQAQGLYCRAVMLDIDKLGKLQDCEAILHLPGINHFVVLGEIDERYVGSIDLSSKKFYSRKETGFFDMDWADGVALLVSENPINIESNFTEISNSELHEISGGNGWQCNDLLQESDDEDCPDDCYGYYEYYPERWGCSYVGYGYCSHSSYTRKEEVPCIKDLYGYCDMTGEWTEYYMWACD
jgi:hypothetical protein